MSYQIALDANIETWRDLVIELELHPLAAGFSDLAEQIRASLPEDEPETPGTQVMDDFNDIAYVRLDSEPIYRWMQINGHTTDVGQKFKWSRIIQPRVVYDPDND